MDLNCFRPLEPRRVGPICEWRERVSASASVVALVDSTRSASRSRDGSDCGWVARRHERHGAKSARRESDQENVSMVGDEQPWRETKGLEDTTQYKEMEEDKCVKAEVEL